MAACTFCGSSQRSVSSRVTGPRAFICGDCVSFAKSALAEADSIAPRTGAARIPLRCSFCDRPAQQVHRLVAGPDVRICDQCVHFADEVLAGRTG
jgi:ATP-dependent protease Clp ATPase subunit